MSQDCVCSKLKQSPRQTIVEIAKKKMGIIWDTIWMCSDFALKYIYFAPRQYFPEMIISSAVSQTQLKNTPPFCCVLEICAFIEHMKALSSCTLCRTVSNARFFLAQGCRTVSGCHNFQMFPM